MAGMVVKSPFGAGGVAGRPAVPTRIMSQVAKGSSKPTAVRPPKG